MWKQIDNWTTDPMASFTAYVLIALIALDNGLGFIGAPIIFATGILLGFKAFQKWQLMENIPTSKIRSLSMGLAEVVGKAARAPVYKAPNGMSCAFYHYNLEEYKQSGKRKSWIGVGDGNSNDYFYIQDETGTLLINTKGADLKLKQDTIESLEKANVSPVVKEILVKHGKASWGKEKKFLVFNYREGNPLRIIQYSVEPGEDVYVIGRVELAQIQNKEMPVVVKDDDHNIFIISDSEEVQISSKIKNATLVHFAASFVGLAWIGMFVI